MNRKEELEGIVFEARSELNEMQDQDRFDQNAKYVGRCYKYKNSYSCPQSDDDRWWLYAMVTQMGEHGSLVGITFQDDKQGKLEFEHRLYMTESTLQVPISQGEFGDALTAFQEKIQRYSEREQIPADKDK